MERLTGLQPREGYVEKLADRGFILNPHDPYWQETTAYKFNEQQIDELDDAAVAVNELCVEAAQTIIDRDLFHKFGIPEEWKDYVVTTWKREDPTIYGRFDFIYDGKTPPKMLEYNADTPTGLLEASVLQWDWLQDRGLPDQFNSIHEELVSAWQRASAHVGGMPEPLCFLSDHDSGEDLVTTEYLRDTADQAGIKTHFMNIVDLGWDGKNFTDLDDNRVPAFFKLYPWEFMVQDEFGQHIRDDHTGVIEPAWKMLWSNKALLPLLWELAPNHPNLLPAYYTPEPFTEKGESYVKKALFGREGASVEIIDPVDGVVSPGPYGQEGHVYQAYHRMPSFDGHFPVCGVWIANGKACGLGIREDVQRVTANASNFVPHYFEA